MPNSPWGMEHAGAELGSGFWGWGSELAWIFGLWVAQAARQVELRPSADFSQPWDVFAVHKVSQQCRPIHGTSSAPFQELCIFLHFSEKARRLCPHGCHWRLLPIYFQALSLQVAPAGSQKGRDVIAPVSSKCQYLKRLSHNFSSLCSRELPTAIMYAKRIFSCQRLQNSWASVITWLWCIVHGVSWAFLSCHMILLELGSLVLSFLLYKI